MTRAPERPADVPGDATWDAQRLEWLSGHKDLTGRWHGLVTGYDAAGLVRSRQQFEAGVAEGPCIRLHPSGAEAYRATFLEGKLHGDARAVSSREPGAVPLRACCVPPGAWALVTRYDRGQWVDQWFENEAGCPLLADGTPRPVRPATVPAAARFDENNPGWVLGAEQDLQREGEWQRWSPSGDVLELGTYQRGKLHGSARLYQEGRLTREREYVNGVLEGPAAEHEVASGTFDDGRIGAWRGVFSEGCATGRWTYWDPSGSLLFERDYGVACRRVELTHPLLAAAPPEGGWAALARRLSAEGEQGLALCAHLRETVAHHDVQGLRERLALLTIVLGATESARRIAQLRKSRGQRETELGAWVQALLEGVSPALVLGELGSRLLAAPRAGLDFIEAASMLEPIAPALLPARAQLWFELGQPERAIEEASELAGTYPRHAAWVRETSGLLFPRFEFWPAQAESVGNMAELEPSPDLPAQVGQSLAQIRGAIVKSALRLFRVRQALLRAWGVHTCSVPGAAEPAQPPWLPPELSSLLSEPLPTLERYEFTDSAGDGDSAGDLVKVDETFEPDALGLTSLMCLARVEWTCLCWLCWGAGLECVGLPDELRPQPEFPRALASAFFQVFRVLDSRQTRGLRSKSRGVPEARWEGLNVDTLEPFLLEMAFREARETRAVLFWLGDEECRSLWQDDLREV